jgi:hypothetical protein
MSKSLKKYILQTEFNNYTTAEYDEDRLTLAEDIIDNAIARFYQGANTPFITYPIFDNAVILTNTTATIGDVSYTNGYFQYTVLEILDGTSKMLKIPVQNSTQSGTTHILTFFDTQNLNETKPCRIYQAGKLPRNQDTIIDTDNIYKVIPEDIKRAIALQYEYLIANPDIATSNFARSHYQVDQAEWSESFDTKTVVTNEERLHPQARGILASLGLTIQTI